MRYSLTDEDGASVEVEGYSQHVELTIDNKVDEPMSVFLDRERLSELSFAINRAKDKVEVR